MKKQEELSVPVEVYTEHLGPHRVHRVYTGYTEVHTVYTVYT